MHVLKPLAAVLLLLTVSCTANQPPLVGSGGYTPYFDWNTHSDALLTTHNPQPNSSRHFGLVAVLVIMTAFIAYNIAVAVCANPSIKQLHDWAKLFLHVDVAKAKVKFHVILC